MIKVETIKPAASVYYSASLSAYYSHEAIYEMSVARTVASTCIDGVTLSRNAIKISPLYYSHYSVQLGSRPSYIRGGEEWNHARPVAGGELALLEISRRKPG
jgi:hypothetical protein